MRDAAAVTRRVEAGATTAELHTHATGQRLTEADAAALAEAVARSVSLLTLVGASASHALDVGASASDATDVGAGRGEERLAAGVEHERQFAHG